VTLDSLVAIAKDAGASDLHLEAGMPAAIRVRGRLQTTGEPISGETTLAIARKIVGDANWPEFAQRRSFDGSRLIRGVHCRINVLITSRGIGLAVRLLAGFQPTLDALNLLPELKKLVQRDHGLILICGPTGSGKTTTLAALIHEVNVGPAKHVLTLENPIEYHVRPRRAFVRQREVGRDTPSFEQGLLDALREDPDVLVVGEMRRRETMQLTLDAAETGHLVLATMHSSTVAEALQRLIASFPAESQGAVRAQLADVLVAGIAQRLQYRADVGLRVPECEVLIATDAVRNIVREGRFFKLQGAMETGASDGAWTFERYRRWLDGRDHWRVPQQAAAEDTTAPPVQVAIPRAPVRTESVPPAGMVHRAGPAAAVATDPSANPASPSPALPGGPSSPVIVIDDGDVGAMEQVLQELEEE
jgi:twitching motility protein PilT